MAVIQCLFGGLAPGEDFDRTLREKSKPALVLPIGRLVGVNCTNFGDSTLLSAFGCHKFGHLNHCQ
jgi:hypothetical protein